MAAPGGAGGARRGDAAAGAPGRVAAARLTERLLPQLRAALATVLGAPVAVRVIVAEAEAAPPGRGAGRLPPGRKPGPPARPGQPPRPARHGAANCRAARRRSRPADGRRAGWSVDARRGGQRRPTRRRALARELRARRRQAGDSGGRPAGGR
ncbi:MAG: hypothetical protein R2853_05200 [Thermomicrobiales bacterium]